MRHSARAARIGVAASLLAAACGGAPLPCAAQTAGAPPTTPAPATRVDTTITRPMPLVDSTRVGPPPVPVLDSTVVLPALVRNLPAAPRDTVARPDTLGLRIPADIARKRGDLTLTQLLLGRRPVGVETAPAFAPLFGTPRLLDTGTPVIPDSSPIAADRATDRTTVADFTRQPTGSPFVLGVPGLATSWDVPESRGVDAFEYVAIDSSLAPAAFRGAGQLLARPQATSFAALAMPDAPGPYRVRSALLYRKGAGNLLDTAARFSSPLFAHGIAGSYARHAGDALRPFLSSISTRYSLAAGITRGGPLHSWVEGRLFKMRMEIDHRSEAEGAFATPATPARGEWAGREGSVHALWTRGGVAASASLHAATTKASQIAFNDAGRERWEYPEVGAQARISGGGAVPDTSGAARGWTWSLEGTGSKRRVDYAASDGTAFRPLIRSGRVTAEVRHAGAGGGVAAAAAGDVRSGDPALVDGRVSLWGERGRARFRLDGESAHERPSFVDLLTPARIDTLPSFEAPTLILVRGGDAALRARSLRGVLGTAALRAAPGVELHAFGSARRLADDFGWTSDRSVSGDTVTLVDAARPRGSGWVFEVAAGGQAAVGFLNLRGLGWARGGDGSVAPRAGSPARLGFDASLGLRGTFFQGDLPLEVELLAHGMGPRHGLVEAGATATCDARLHADFGSAGLFLSVTNLFDATVPSGVYRIDLDDGAPLPGRSLFAGVVWYIQD